MPSTRSSDPKPPKTHILDFFHGDDDGCAFTVRINDVRFHISIDPAKLKGKDGEESEMLKEYQMLLWAVKEQERAEEGGSEGQDKEEKKEESIKSEDRDSGVDVSTDAKPAAEGGDAALELQNWVLKCFSEEVPHQTTEEETSHTLREWYETPIKYFEMSLTSDNTLAPTAIEETDILRKRLDDLLPRVPLPKKLRELPIPWLSPVDINVLTDSADPPPIHPCLVRAAIDSGEEKTYFFKPVDPSQPQPTKREIDLLHKIHIKKFDQDFNVPHLHALVSFQNSKVETMGFLLTAIDDPIPLTKLLDSEVDESKRKRWATESKRIVGVLHENGIVWGDAKADNFLVDRQDKLWVIDFGGSFTEGWVDPELNETVEGDDMGVGRIVEGLKDPDGMTCDPEDVGIGGVVEKKRKRGSEGAEEDEQDEENEVEYDDVEGAGDAGDGSEAEDDAERRDEKDETDQPAQKKVKR